MRSFRALIGATVLTLACGDNPHIEYKRLLDSELVQQAPIIVIGRISKREIFWRERVRHGRENGEALYWYHVTVRVAVENVLRGDVEGSPIEYTYWIPVGAKVGQWNHPLDGIRYFHFLRREGTQLRSIVDFWPSTIHVSSGRHRWVNESEPLPARIAHLLLIPGDDNFVPERYNLVEAYDYASRLAQREALVTLQELADSRDDPVRQRACEVLANLNSGGKGTCPP
jgi:hypothetical protein